MTALQSITGGLGSSHSFQMMSFRTLRFPGSRSARALPSSMDQRYGYHHVNMAKPHNPARTTPSSVCGRLWIEVIRYWSMLNIR